MCDELDELCDNGVSLVDCVLIVEVLCDSGDVF